MYCNGFKDLSKSEHKSELWVWVSGFLIPPISTFLTPAVCLRIPLNVYTIYAKITSASKGKRSVWPNCPPPQHTSEASSKPRLLPWFWLTGYKSKVPMNALLNSISSLEQLTELREILLTTSLDIIPFRGYNSGTAKWQRG